MNNKSIKLLEYIDRNSPCSYAELKDVFDVNDSCYPYYSILFEENFVDGKDINGILCIYLTPEGEDFLYQLRLNRKHEIEERVWKFLTLAMSIIAIIISLTK